MHTTTESQRHTKQPETARCKGQPLSQTLALNLCAPVPDPLGKGSRTRSLFSSNSAFFHRLLLYGVRAAGERCKSKGPSAKEMGKMAGWRIKGKSCRRAPPESGDRLLSLYSRKMIRGDIALLPPLLLPLYHFSLYHFLTLLFLSLTSWPREGGGGQNELPEGSRTVG